MSWGNPQTFSERALTTMLAPVGLAYGTGSFVRLMAYSSGLLKQQHFPATVISVGNITCGGTGKTPVTIDLAQRLIDSGHKVGILSRGYRRLSKEPIVVASNGRGEFADCTVCGDEPFLMARSAPEAVVIVGAKRVLTARLAIERYGCDVLLLDDGFQHLPIARNTDVVLLDYNDDLGRDHLLPAGRLREPVSALARANWVIVTKVPENPDLDRLLSVRTLIGRYSPDAEVSSCRMQVDSLQPFGCPDVKLGPSTLNGQKVIAFSGIARPDALAKQLVELGAEVAANVSFGDHHWYSLEDMQHLELMLGATGAELLVTTEKDSVKLLPGMVKDLPLAVLKQRLEWLGPLPLQHSLQPSNAALT